MWTLRRVSWVLPVLMIVLSACDGLRGPAGNCELELFSFTLTRSDYLGEVFREMKMIELVNPRFSPRSVIEVYVFAVGLYLPLNTHNLMPVFETEPAYVVREGCVFIFDPDETLLGDTVVVAILSS